MPMASNTKQKKVIAEKGGLKLTEEEWSKQDLFEEYGLQHLNLTRLLSSMKASQIARSLQIFLEVGIIEPKQKPQSEAERALIRTLVQMTEIRNVVFHLMTQELDEMKGSTKES